MKKRTLSLLVFSFSLLVSSAQTAKEEIYADILKSGSNYMAYQAPKQALTPAPKGYEPFYMSHYGRHGSRWLINENDYTSVLRVFRRANEQGKLTALGKEALEKLERFIPTTRGRLGELSDIGEQQHHGIGHRMTVNFPEIFSGKDAEVDARSTVVIRCILSMTAECEELTAFNSNMKMHNDVSESFQYYLNHNFSQRLRDASRDRASIVSQYAKKYTHPERFCRALFNDESYWNDEDFRPRSFMRSVFNVITNMQSHGNGEDMWNLFTTEECYDLWKIVNIDWYLGYGAAPQTGSIMQFNQADLLHNMIETTDPLWHPRPSRTVPLFVSDMKCALCLLPASWNSTAAVVRCRILTTLRTIGSTIASTQWPATSSSSSIVPRSRKMPQFLSRHSSTRRKPPFPFPPTNIPITNGKTSVPTT